MLLPDPRVAAVPVRDSGEPLTELDESRLTSRFVAPVAVAHNVAGAAAAVYGPVGGDQVAR